jgi:GNAT superfamily N-acetyltransferase
MTDVPQLTLIEFDQARLDGLVLMWRAGLQAAVGIIDPHPFDEHRRYVLTEVLPHNTVRLATLGARLVGFVAATPESVAQLHVRVGYWRRGIGTRLLAWAKTQSSGRLWLYTFERNHAARAFYERHGFVAVAHGFEPDWQLDNIRYEWSEQQRTRATGDN